MTVDLLSSRPRDFHGRLAQLRKLPCSVRIFYTSLFATEIYVPLTLTPIWNWICLSRRPMKRPSSGLVLPCLFVLPTCADKSGAAPHTEAGRGKSEFIPVQFQSHPLVGPRGSMP